MAAAVVIAVAVGRAGFHDISTYLKESSAVASATPLVTPKFTGGSYPIAGFLAAARACKSTHLSDPETGKRVRVTTPGVLCRERKLFPAFRGHDH